MIGTDVVCGVSQCEYAWVFSSGYLAVVIGDLSGPGIPMTSHGFPGAMPIGIRVLTAITG